jgi:hypothetical protein
MQPQTHTFAAMDGVIAVDGKPTAGLLALQAEMLQPASGRLAMTPPVLVWALLQAMKAAG